MSPASASTKSDAASATAPRDEGRRRAPSLIPFEWSYEAALELIRHPVCNMPPVPESEVSDAEVAQIVAYLKTIK